MWDKQVDFSKVKKVDESWDDDYNYNEIDEEINDYYSDEFDNEF